MKIITLALTISLFFSINYSFAVEPALSITDREIIESLARIEAGMKSIQNSVEKNRQEITQNRQEIAQNRREFFGFMQWGFGVIFTGIFILIGFILWDRRSVLKPVKDDLAELKTKRVANIIKVMKIVAETDKDLKDAMRREHLL